jgi:hypothetical protein
MAIYNNETDPNVKQWENEQHERSMLVSPSYREWWEANKERILAEDKLNHDMQFKAAYHKQGDY